MSYNNIENIIMTIQEEHIDRVVRLLRKYAERQKYIREYMKEYRAKTKAETGVGQKQHYSPDNIKSRQRVSYKIKTAINDIKILFQE